MLTLLAFSTPAHSRDIYLLMGQSNISGRGVVADLTEAERIPDPNIRLFGNDDRWRAALDPLDEPAEQVDLVSADDNAAVGPGLFFARSFHSATQRSIGIVPCAKGGSGIAAWARDQQRTSLYGSCIARARQAAKKGQIAGIIWYQGESDARTFSLAEAWPGAFASLIKDLRRDLGKPHLPVVAVILADAPDKGENAGKYPAWGEVQAAQETLSLPHLAWVSAQGLPRQPDALHLTTDAQRKLGPLLATAMQSLTRSKDKAH